MRGEEGEDGAVEEGASVEEEEGEEAAGLGEAAEVVWFVVAGEREDGDVALSVTSASLCRS